MHRWKYLFAIALVVGLAAGLTVAARGSRAEPPGGFAGLKDLAGPPGDRLPGELNRDAVAKAVHEERLPVAWLGEQFGPFALTRYAELRDSPRPGGEAFSPSVLRVVLLYGDCTETGRTESSCAAPVQVHVTAPGVVPGPEEIVSMPGWGKVSTIRGLKSIEGEGNTMFWLEDGTVITIYTPADLRHAAVQALSSANHETMGRPPVLAAGSLDALNRFSPRTR